MLNQIVLVGRLVSDPQINETENGAKECNITLAVPIKLYEGIAENTVEYCKKGDLLGIKGRIQTKQEENKNIIEIVAERVTFLSSRKETEEE